MSLSAAIGAPVKAPSFKPSHKRVEMVLRKMSNEGHYLMTKPIAKWDKYDMANWKAIVRKFKGFAGTQAQVGGQDWVQDPDKWAQARKAALKDRDADHPAYWSLVTHHYKQAGGRIRATDAQVGGWHIFPKDVEPSDQLTKGIEHEKEHYKTLSRLYAQDLTINQAVEAIAKDHLASIPDYYDRLARMEQEARS